MVNLLMWGDIDMAIKHIKEKKGNVIQFLADEFKEEILSGNEEIDTAYYCSEITPEIAYQVEIFIAKHFSSPLVSVIINSIDRILELKERVYDEETQDVLLTEYRDIVIDVFYMYVQKQEEKIKN